MTNKIETLEELNHKIDAGLKESKQMIKWITIILFFSLSAISLSFYSLLYNGIFWIHISILFINSYIVSDYICKFVDVFIVYQNFKKLKKDFS